MGDHDGLETVITIARNAQSTNGTRVNGSRVTGKRLLRPGDEIAVGVFTLAYDGARISVKAHAEGAPLAANAVSKKILPKGTLQPLLLLDNVSLLVPHGELVCIVGASGSGKSTLMNILSGRKRPTSGSVRLGEYDVHSSFDTLKQGMAYVPQADMLHEVLTLRQALNFVADLRLPRDLSSAAKDQIVTDAASSVGLEHRLDQKIGMLSGGQKKRASLATEILSRPNLLFLDEVTSGLDESTDREIMGLLKRLSQKGMTIVCVTHTLANIATFADKVVVLGEGGLLTFYGSPTDMMSFFGIRQLGEAFEVIDKSGAPSWQRRFLGNPRAAESHPPSGAVPRAEANGQQLGALSDRLKLVIHQFLVLTRRNVALLLGDMRALIMSAVQSVVVGGLLGYAFSDFGSGILELSNSKLSFLLVLGITCLWIGVAGAAKEIVGELPIYLRERDINLSTLAFVLSKFVVVSAFTVIQVGLLMMICSLLAQEIPGGFLMQFLIACVASISGVGLGLVISSVANSRDQAAVVVPLALAPQLIFGSGLVTNMGAAGDFLAKLVIGAYWAREAMTAALISSESVVKLDPSHMVPIQVTAHTLSASLGALGLQTLAWFAVATAIMYARFRRKSE